MSDAINVQVTEVSAVATPSEAPEQTQTQEATEVTPVEENVLEAQAEPSDAPKEEEAPKDKFSTRFNQLAKKEKALVEREARVKDLESREKALSAAIDDIKKNPLAALQEIGMTFEELAELVLTGPVEDSEEVKKSKGVESKLAELEAKLAKNEEKERQKQEEAEKRQLEADNLQLNETINKFKQQIKSDLEKEVDKYELIAINGAHEAVYDVIEEVFKQTGKVLSWQEAADQVEAHFETEAKKYNYVKKSKQAQEMEKKESSQDTVKSPETTLKVTPTTLSNKTMVRPSGKNVTKKTVTHDLSDDKARAAALLKWK